MVPRTRDDGYRVASLAADHLGCSGSANARYDSLGLRPYAYSAAALRFVAGLSLEKWANMPEYAFFSGGR